MKLILEAGACRNDIGWALEAVDVAADLAWGFKVQLFRPETIASPEARTYGKGLGEPATQRENFAGALSYDQWAQVADRCRSRGLEFLASPFDLDAVEVLSDIGVSWFKVASADITYRQLVEACVEAGGNLIVSTGGCTTVDIERAVGWLPLDRTVLLACTLSYPCPPHEAHMARMDTLREFGSRWVGYSDHTPGADGIETARMLGADFCEKHFTITPGVGGDHDFAVTADEIPGEIDERMVGSPVVAPRRVEFDARLHARRSLHYPRDMTAGERIERFDMLRPGFGVPPYQADEFIGRTLRRDVKRHELFYRGDV